VGKQGARNEDAKDKFIGPTSHCYTTDKW